MVDGHHQDIVRDITESLVTGALEGAHSNAAFPWCVEINVGDKTFSVSPTPSQTGPALPPDAPPVVSIEADSLFSTFCGLNSVYRHSTQEGKHWILTTAMDVLSNINILECGPQSQSNKKHDRYGLRTSAKTKRISTGTGDSLYLTMDLGVNKSKTKPSEPAQGNRSSSRLSSRPKAAAAEEPEKPYDPEPCMRSTRVRLRDDLQRAVDTVLDLIGQDLPKRVRQFTVWYADLGSHIVQNHGETEETVSSLGHPNLSRILSRC